MAKPAAARESPYTLLKIIGQHDPWFRPSHLSEPLRCHNTDDVSGVSHQPQRQRLNATKLFKPLLPLPEREGKAN